MKEKTEKRTGRDDLRREYDLSKLKGVRGKYAARYRAGTNLVLLSPDVAKYFPDEQAVNTALRTLIQFRQIVLTSQMVTPCSLLSFFLHNVLVRPASSYER